MDFGRTPKTSEAIDSAPTYDLIWVSHLAEIDRQEWDALAQPLATPFLEWSWLENLESSGCAVPREGWLPMHLTVRRSGRLVGAAPLYIKGHSYGEFVFDQQWAALAHRLGVDYYPKLVGTTPFTPAEGYRFLIAPEEDEARLTQIMLSQIDHFCDRNGLSGCHFLFVDPAWQPLVEAQGFMPWKHHSYIWQNQNFATFDDYLAAFNANQRRNIKRERKAIETSGLALRVLTGDGIPTRYFSEIYDFYSSTCDKFWGGSKYLNRKFFTQLHTKFQDRVMLVVAHDRSELARLNLGQGSIGPDPIGPDPIGPDPIGPDPIGPDPIAPDLSAQDPDRLPSPLGLSFCIYKGDRLYGRYWGSRDEIDCLHFNACYYEPIQWAIDHGIQYFDPGAGGQHKKRRGFPATPNHSLHRLYNSRLESILQSHLGEINDLEAEQIAAINQELPFTKAIPNLENC